MKHDVELLLVHRSNFGRMPLLPSPMTHMVGAEVEPRLVVCKSVAFTIEPRMLLLLEFNSSKLYEY